MAPNKLLAYTIEPIISPKSDNPTTQVENTVSQVIGILTVIGVIYFAIQLILGGYAYLSSEGDKSKLESARKRLTNSILGLLIIIIAVGITALLASLAGLDNIFDLNLMFTKMGL